MWAWKKTTNKHLMCWYTCKGLYSHRVLLGESFENVTGLALGQTVYVFGVHVSWMCFSAPHLHSALSELLMTTNHPNLSKGCLVNLVSWNVKSLNHPEKRRKVFTHLQQLKIEETHLRYPDHLSMKSGWSLQL